MEAGTKLKETKVLERGLYGGIKMEITELRREDENAWDEYVHNSNNSTFYHQIGWRNVVAMTEEIQTVDDGMIEKMLIEEAKRIWKD